MLLGRVDSLSPDANYPGGRAILRASVVADGKAMSVMSHTPVVD